MSHIIPLFRASASARALLAPADAELARAAVELDPADRYIAAHLAAVHAACAFIDLVGTRPSHQRKSVWEQLVSIDPDWMPWSAYFSGGTKLRKALEMGVPVAARVADEMTRYAEDFRDEIALAVDPACEWLPGVPADDGAAGSASFGGERGCRPLTGAVARASKPRSSRLRLAS